MGRPVGAPGMIIVLNDQIRKVSRLQDLDIWQGVNEAGDILASL